MAAGVVAVREPRRQIKGGGGFASWSLVGALFSLSVLGAASIGLLLVLPVAVATLLFVGSTVRPWPESAGVLEGVAALSLFVAFANRDSTPCPASGSGYAGPGSTGTSFSCGGLDPLPWLVVGMALAGAGIALYSLGRARS